ncbi:MAG: hypothetical protein U9Q73_02450 [Nanoarchaeota archaeon]|nr:hypothetical protein [Nanoarchaeota archaeon]
MINKTFKSYQEFEKEYFPEQARKKILEAYQKADFGDYLGRIFMLDLKSRIKTGEPILEPSLEQLNKILVKLKKEKPNLHSKIISKIDSSLAA